MILFSDKKYLGKTLFSEINILHEKTRKLRNDTKFFKYTFLRKAVITIISENRLLFSLVTAF